MNNSVYRITLDLQKTEAQYALRAKQWDTARTIVATFTDGGKPFDVTACYPVLTGKNANGESLFLECAIAGNVVVYNFTNAISGVVGEVECEIQLYNQDPEQGGAVMITSARFLVVVEDGVYNENDPEAMERYDALSGLIKDVTLAKSEAEDAAATANDAAEDIKQRAESGEFDGAPGERGEKGDPGAPGQDGKTPVNGVDYNTPEEREALLEDLQIKTGIKQTASGTVLTLQDSADCRFQAFTLDGGNAGESVNIEVAGKNLFNIANISDKVAVSGTAMSLTARGVYFDIFTGEVGPSTKVPAAVMEKLPYLPAGTYTISYKSSGNLSDSFYMRIYAVADDGSVTAAHTSYSMFMFTLGNASKITIRQNESRNVTIENLQIERGSVATDYEPFQNQTVTVEANGGKVDVLAQHPDLRTYHHTTFVSNDKDIPMAVTYVADTKEYVDNKFAELASAFISNV